MRTFSDRIVAGWKPAGGLQPPQKMLLRVQLRCGFALWGQACCEPAGLRWAFLRVILTVAGSQPYSIRQMATHNSVAFAQDVVTSVTYQFFQPHWIRLHSNLKSSSQSGRPRTWTWLQILWKESKSDYGVNDKKPPFPPKSLIVDEHWE